MDKGDTSREASNGVKDATKANVLLVDDDKFLLDMYGMKFAAAGYRVEACLSPKQALEILRGGFLPDVILFDIIMPEMDGFAFLKALADEKMGVSALKIALTNQSDETEKKKAAEMGASRYIIKASMIPSEVVSTVGDELAKRAK
jgi:CheY-like chemotaxis protein